MKPSVKPLLAKAVRRGQGDVVASQYLQIVDELRLRDLQFICEIASSHSLTQAAERFHLTQPAASRLLGQIEKGLQVSLFERHRTRGMLLTPAGVLAVGRSNTVLADMQTLASELISLKAGVKGELRLGSIFFLSAQLLRDVIVELVSAPSELRLSVREGDSPALIELIKQEALDIAIVRCSPLHAGDGMYQQPLFQQRACLVTHPASTIATYKSMSIEQLRNHTWVLPPSGSPTRVAFDDAFLKQHLPAPRPVLETASSKVIHSVVSAVPGMVAVVPSEVGRDLVDMGGVVNVPLPFPLDLPPIGLICLRRHLHEPAINRARATLTRLVARGIALD